MPSDIGRHFLFKSTSIPLSTTKKKTHRHTELISVAILQERCSTYRSVAHRMKFNGLIFLVGEPPTTKEIVILNAVKNLQAMKNRPKP